MLQLKLAIQKCFNLFNLKISRIDKADQNIKKADRYDFEACMMGILAAQNHVRLVQVGANDGRINDPVYRFVNKYRKDTSVVLVEPQEFLIPILKENYKDHPRAVVLKGAVGESSVSTFYMVAKEVWEELDVPYAKEWPVYRAPSGVTSQSKDHVRKWLQYFTKKTMDQVDAMIVEQRIETEPLENLLCRHNLPFSVDVLQVDTEGFDDVVIFNSLSERIQPKVINFEYYNLEKERLANCVAWLEEKGFECFRGKSDMLCVRTRCRS